MTLNEIGLKYNADKSSRFHHYLDFYEEMLPGREFSGRLLEIGIMDGLSMKMWREYYPHAEIMGVDIYDKEHLYNSDWQVPTSVKMLHLDGTKKEDMEPLGMFDIIIDDGSHFMKDQQGSFLLLYPNQLNKDGVYILEDLWTSYIDYYQNAKITTLKFLKNLEKRGVQMTYFRYKHEGIGIGSAFPGYSDLESETVVIQGGQSL